MSAASRPLPARTLPSLSSITLLVLAAVFFLALRLAGVMARELDHWAWIAFEVFCAGVIADFLVTRRAWRALPISLERRLPAALAIGVATDVTLCLTNPGPYTWSCELFDLAAAPLETEGLPQRVTLVPHAALEVSYRMIARRRGDARFDGTALRVRSRLRLLDLSCVLGSREFRRVYPNFFALARFGWLASARHPHDPGIKAIRKRGTGTDFRQLNEYQTGDQIRHIDWRATQRMRKPIVREYQDDRNQQVVLMIDCGRRLRADDRRSGQSLTHFDQVLNAAIELAYVALKRGDAVGVMPFGQAEADASAFAPTKGLVTLQRLLSVLYALQPSLAQSDYTMAARRLMVSQPKRALVVLITNFRDEDEDELRQALRLLRTRHLVLLASLTESVVRAMIDQPLRDGDAALEVAGAHFYEQGRRRLFARLAAGDRLILESEPHELGTRLVNRYHEVKRAGLL